MLVHRGALSSLQVVFFVFISTIAICGESSLSYAQSRSHSQWFFGLGCALSWSEDNQVTLGTNPRINTLEGVATFSHPTTGELILYTDGINAWNAQDAQINTGPLGGDPSASQ